MRLSRIERKLPAIKDFLTARGAEVLAPTNAYEVLRFRTGRGTSVLYRKDSGQITHSGESLEALTAFFQQGPWTAGAATKRGRPPEVAALLARDGDDCFLCLLPLGEDITREHLVSLASGGPNHIANLALAHGACNARMSHLSLMEKIGMRERHLLARRAPQPALQTALGAALGDYREAALEAATR